MPLAHESALLKRLDEERDRKALKEAYEAAKPFLRHWMRERDRIYLTKGTTGTHVEFPFFVEDQGLWHIKLPWTVAQHKAEAWEHAERMKAEADTAMTEIMQGKTKPGWFSPSFRRFLDRIGRGEDGDLDPDDCPRCKGLGQIITRVGSEQCPDCGGDGYRIDEEEDGEA